LRELAAELANVVELKRASYGHSWPTAIAGTLRAMFPDGVRPEQFETFLFIARLQDKLHRLAAAPEAFGEDTLRDIAGYTLLMLGSESPSGSASSTRSQNREVLSCSGS